jgi:hypothetical protein
VRASSYFRIGDYVRWKSNEAVIIGHEDEESSEGYVRDVTSQLITTKNGHYWVETVQVRTNQGGLWTAPYEAILPIRPSEEEIARRQLGEDYL